MLSMLNRRQKVVSFGIRTILVPWRVYLVVYLPDVAV